MVSKNVNILLLLKSDEDDDINEFAINTYDILDKFKKEVILKVIISIKLI